MQLYNIGFLTWFGVGAAWCILVGGCLLAIIFPLLQRDNLVGAYLTLMVMLSIITLPAMAHIGTLNKLSNIAILMVLIFTEIFYGPVLNYRFVFQSSTGTFYILSPNASGQMGSLDDIIWPTQVKTVLNTS